MLSNLRRDELLSTSAPVVLCETLRNGAGIQALEAHFPPQVYVFVMHLDGNVLPTPVDKTGQCLQAVAMGRNRNHAHDGPKPRLGVRVGAQCSYLHFNT